MTQPDDPVDPEGDQGADGAGAAVGTVAEEAAKLLGALSGWAREQGDGLQEGLSQGMSAIADELHEHVATGTPECAWCPVCRTVAALRQASPEVRAHLSSAASSLALAVSGMLTTRPPARDDDGRVQRIRLDDADDAGDAGDRDDDGWDAWPEDSES